MVMVPNSKEQVEAWVKICTHDAKFAWTGGDHFTSDDKFNSAEMRIKKAQISKQKEEEKTRLERKMRKEEALKVLEIGEPTASLIRPECNILLWWLEVPNTMNGKAAEKRKRLEEVL